MSFTLLDALIGAGGLLWIAGLFYPELLWKFVNSPTEKKYSSKENLKIRIICILGLLICITIYIYSNYF